MGTTASGTPWIRCGTKQFSPNFGRLAPWKVRETEGANVVPLAHAG
jgi:hypothetical protein